MSRQSNREGSSPRSQGPQHLVVIRQSVLQFYDSQLEELKASFFQKVTLQVSCLCFQSHYELAVFKTGSYFFLPYNPSILT